MSAWNITILYFSFISYCVSLFTPINGCKCCNFLPWNMFGLSLKMDSIIRCGKRNCHQKSALYRDAELRYGLMCIKILSARCKCNSPARACKIVAAFILFYCTWNHIIKKRSLLSKDTLHRPGLRSCSRWNSATDWSWKQKLDQLVQTRSLCRPHVFDWCMPVAVRAQNYQ